MDQGSQNMTIDITEKMVWNRLELTGTGKYFLKRTRVTQVLRRTFKKWDPHEAERFFMAISVYMVWDVNDSSTI